MWHAVCCKYNNIQVVPIELSPFNYYRGDSSIEVPFTCNDMNNEYKF